MKLLVALICALAIQAMCYWLSLLNLKPYLTGNLAMLATLALIWFIFEGRKD